MNQLFFYKRTLRPADCTYYHHQLGIAGMKEPDNKKELLLYGTLEDLENYLKNRERPSRDRRRHY